MNPLMTTLWIGVGGALGTISRYWIGTWTLPISRELPLGTIAINVIGSFIIGFIGTLTLATGRHPLPENGRLFIMVGICGGFTTFSSFSLQTLDLLRSGAWTRALVNVALSVLLCIAAVAAGHGIAELLNGNDVRVAQTAIEEES